MKQIVIEWAGDAPSSGDSLPDGVRWVATQPGVVGAGVQMWNGAKPFPPGQPGILDIRIDQLDGLSFAGQGQRDREPGYPRACEWLDGKWQDRGMTGGPRSVIYVGHVLHVARPPGPYYGYRQVRANGTIIPASSETLPNSQFDPARGLFELFDFGDVAIGQGDDEQVGGGVVIRFADESFLRRLTFQRLYDHGRIININVSRSDDGQRFGIVAVDLGRHITPITWGTLAELRAMKRIVATTPPPPPPDPPPPEPPTMDMPSSAWLIVKRMFNERRFLFDANEDGARKWTRATAEQLAFSLPGGGWSLKSTSPNGTPGKDVVARPRPNDQTKIEGWELLTASGAQGPRELTDPPEYQSLDGQFAIPVAPVNHLGVTAPPPPPDEPPVPPVDDEWRAQIEARLAALEGPRSVAIRNISKNKYLRHDWARNTAKFDRDAVGGEGEIHVIEPIE